jgi:hypothetical protein
MATLQPYFSLSPLITIIGHTESLLDTCPPAYYSLKRDHLGGREFDRS